MPQSSQRLTPRNFPVSTPQLFTGSARQLSLTAIITTGAHSDSSSGNDEKTHVLEDSAAEIPKTETNPSGSKMRFVTLASVGTPCLQRSALLYLPISINNYIYSETEREGEREREKKRERREMNTTQHRRSSACRGQQRFRRRHDMNRVGYKYP